MNERVINRREETQSDFKKIARELFFSLQSNKENIEKFSTFGQIFTKTSKGKELLIDTLRHDDTTSENVLSMGNLFLIAKEKDTNKIVGIRTQTIRKDNDGNETSDGNIVTNIRGEGMASAIDSVLYDVLQKYSDKNKVPISWVVRNENLLRLRYLRRKYEDTPETEVSLREDLQKEILLKTEEQNRWQSLYGENGKFEMIPTPDFFDPIGSIYISVIKPRKESEGDTERKVSPKEFNQILKELEGFSR